MLVLKTILMALSGSTPCLRVLEAESTHHRITFTVMLLSLWHPLDLFWGQPEVQPLARVLLFLHCRCVYTAWQKDALPKHGWKDCSSLSSSFSALAYDIARLLTVDDRCPNHKWLPCFEAFVSTTFCSDSDFSVSVKCWKVKIEKKENILEKKRPNYWDIFLKNESEITH